MKPFLWSLAVGSIVLAAPARAELYYLIVQGLGGEQRYTDRFSAQVESLAASARRSLGGEAGVTVLAGENATRESLTAELERLAEATTAEDSLVVFLVGHGTFDGMQYKYNLPGPDIDGETLGDLLAAVPASRQVIVNTTSASGAIVEPWAADGRMLIAATKSGGERNATRFGEHWTAALSSDEADANKNGAITVQEAFDYAERKVADSYESEGLLATEHPQLVGESPDSFNVALLEARVATTEELERLLAELDQLEGEVAALRLQREEMDNDVYLDELQSLMLELALVQREIDDARGEGEE